MNIVLSTALSGLNDARERVNDASARIAQGSDVSTDGGANVGANLPRDIVDLKLGEASFKANAHVVRVVDDMDEELSRLFDETI